MPYNWQPRDYQVPAWRALQNGVKRASLVWHRRGGKDLFAVNWIAREMARRVGLYWHLFPTYSQGRKIAWQGMTYGGRRFVDHFPKEWMSGQPHDQDMRLEWVNGSIYQVVGSDDIDRLVGANPVGIVISEWSLCDPKIQEFLRPILSENDGWCIYIFTPRGKNHGYDTHVRALEQMAVNPKRWFGQLLTVEDTKAISKEAIEQDRAEGMPDELIKQEYYCSFDASMVGTYYGSIFEKLEAENRICDVGYDASLPVHTWWDLGMRDSTGIWFYQENGLDMRFIRYYENSGEGLAHYAAYLDKLGYAFGQHIAPHDIMVREMGTGQSRIETARKLGLKFRVAPKLSIEDGHQAVRNILMRCWFDKTNCKRGVDGLRQYQKEWDDKKGVFRDTPLHNWASHPADAFRTGAVGAKNFSQSKVPTQTRGETNYRLMARK